MPLFSKYHNVRWRPTLLLGACLAAGLLSAQQGRDTVLPPDVPPPTSPVAVFRQLLGSSPAEREAQLAARPEGKRIYLRKKLQEYLELTPEERERRLASLQLRWYLEPLMRTPPSERATRLKQIFGPERALIEQRLRFWDGLPPGKQQELLSNEMMMVYLTQIDSPVPAARPATAPPLPDAMPREPARLVRHLRRFFELSEKQRARVLNALPPEDRIAFENTMKNFDRLGDMERKVYLDGLDRLTQMPRAEQEQFLGRLARWRSMSPEERDSWKQVVRMVPPLPQTVPGSGPLTLTASNAPAIP